MDPESLNSVFALFECLGAILYKMLIAGPMDLVRCIPGICRGFVEQGKMAFNSGEQRKKGRKAKF